MMGIEALVLATQLFGAAISPHGYAYKQGYLRDSIYLRDSCGQGQVIADTTNERGSYLHSFDVPFPTDSVFIAFWKDGDTANVRDYASDNSNGYRIPEVVLYPPGQRNFTVSAYRLDTTDFRFGNNLEGILENLTRSPSPTPDTAMLFGNDSSRAFSHLVSHIRAEPGDSLRLSLRGVRNDTTFVSDTVLVAEDIGYGDAIPFEDSLAIETRRNYGTWFVPAPEETIPPVPRDLGVSRVVSPADTADSGQVVTPRAWIRNYGSAAASGTARLRIGSTYERDTSFSPIQPGDSASVTFADWTASVRGPQLVNCSTMVIVDTNPGNDRLTDTTFVRVRDAAAAGFLNPGDGDTLRPSVPETVAVSIGNLGNVPLETVAVGYLVSTDSACTDTVYAAWDTTYNVQPGTFELRFTEPWTPQTVGKRYVLLAVAGVDGDPTNNSLHGVCYVGDGSGLAGEDQNRAIKVLPTVLRAPLDLRRVKGELHDVLGRRVTGVRLEAGLYYLVTPERTRKLLVVR
jgi:hypothetical protein